jgi:hypothetical protein
MPDRWGRPEFNDFMKITDMAGNIQAIQGRRRDNAQRQTFEGLNTGAITPETVGPTVEDQAALQFYRGRQKSERNHQAGVRTEETSKQEHARKAAVDKYAKQFAQMDVADLDRVDFSQYGNDALPARMAFGQVLTRRRKTGSERGMIMENRAKMGMGAWKDFSGKRAAAQQYYNGGDSDSAAVVLVDTVNSANNAYRAQDNGDGTINVYTIKEGQRQEGKDMMVEDVLQLVNQIGKRDFAQHYSASVQDALNRNEAASMQPLVFKKGEEKIDVIPKADPFSNAVTFDVFKDGRVMVGADGNPVMSIQDLAKMGFRKEDIGKDKAEVDLLRAGNAADNDKTTHERNAIALDRDKMAVTNDQTTIDRNKIALERDEMAIGNDRTTIERNNVGLEKDRVALGTDLSTKDKPTSMPNTPSMWDPTANNGEGGITQNQNYVQSKTDATGNKVTELKGRLDFLLRRSFAPDKQTALFSADGSPTAAGEDALMKAQAFIEDNRNTPPNKLSIQDKRKFKEAVDALKYWAAVRDFITGRNAPAAAQKPAAQSPQQAPVKQQTWRDY